MKTNKVSFMMGRRGACRSIAVVFATAAATVGMLESASSAPGSAPPSAALPNIVYILCDDLGYGDIHGLNPLRGKIPTPRMDQLATQGMVFTNAHAGSSVCTPSRYGILTGRYGWRSRLQTFILGIYDPPLIAADRLTVPGLLRLHGYHTAGTGKWHLGGKVPVAGDNVLTHRPIEDGPVTRGFDEYRCVDFRNFPPFRYTENDRFVGSPLLNVTTRSAPPQLLDDEYMDALPTTVDWAVQDIRRRAAHHRPFFLFVAPTAPHTPLAVKTASASCHCC
jgi:arylsulfatase A-like enzyme